jgi:hypothetical protein
MFTTLVINIFAVLCPLRGAQRRRNLYCPLPIAHCPFPIGYLAIWLLAIFTMSNVANLCNAYFADLGVGVRPMSLGGAYVALADDASALFWNTAGLSQLENREFIASYSALYYGLDLQLYDGRRDQLGYHLLAYAHPLKTGSKLSSFGIGWTTFSSQLYSEKVFNFGYSLGFTRRFRAGINLKFLSLSLQENEYTKLDPDLSHLSLSRFGNSLDLSALYASPFGLHFGASVENLRPVDMGMIETERLPIKVAVGAAHRSSSNRNIQSLEVSYRNSKIDDKGDFNFKIGLEHWLLMELLALRAGYNFRFVSAGFGIRYQRLPLEVLESLDLQFDYAFLYPIASIVDSYGSHRVAISVRF